MKKYSSRAVKWLIVVSLICGVVLLTGIILAFAGIENIGLPIGLILMGGLLGVIFFGCFLAEKSRTLIMDTDRVIFPRGCRNKWKGSFSKNCCQEHVILVLLKANFTKVIRLLLMIAFSIL